MNRREFLGAMGVAGAGSLAGCGTVLGSGGDFDVATRATSFDPPTVTVGVGEEVVWYNTSARGHTVTAYDDGIPEEADYFASGGFDSEDEAREAWNNWRSDPEKNGLITSGESYSHTFEVPGRYRYVCLPHEQAGMVGMVVVEERSETTSE
ncbi:MAG: plastocyanin/azurin family copper-binding protein [Haloferacaceae archaeon]